MKTVEIGKYGETLQLFAPSGGKNIAIGAYTPSRDEAIILATDTSITMNAIAITYSAGSVIGLIGGQTYTFGAAVDVHYM